MNKITSLLHQYDDVDIHPIMLEAVQTDEGRRRRDKKIATQRLSVQLNKMYRGTLNGLTFSIQHQPENQQQDSEKKQQPLS